MNNCLVTKLKGTVDNDQLFKLGELRVKIGKDDYLGFAADDSQTISVVDGDLLFDGQTTCQLTNGFQDLVNITGEGTVSIPNKYNLTFFEANFKEKVDLNELRYCTKLNVINLKGSDLAYSLDDFNIESSVLTVIKFNNSRYVRGSINKLLKYNLRTLWFHSDAKYFTETDFSILGKFRSCVDYGSTMVNSRLAGSIEDFVAQKRLARTAAGLEVAGSCIFYWLGDGGNVTFQGTPITNVNDNTISWTANTITYNGITINA